MSPSRFVSRRHQLFTLGTAFGALWLGPLGRAAAQGAASSGAFDASDRKFVEAASQGGMAEVAMGRMAQQRSSDAKVKSFGQRMVEDHGKANEDLKRVAAAKGVRLPATLGSAHQGHADQLAKLSGAEFDRAYMKHMLEDHRQDVSDFDKAAKSAADAEVKAFAARTLPTLQAHMQLAQATYDAIK